MSFVQKFYTSDHHFGHALMLTACARPFETTRDMDECLIDVWNSVVRPADLVFHLGDFSMGLNDPNRVQSIFRRLNGRKRLVLGNHDFSKPNVVHPTLAALDWDAPPAAAMETTDEGERVYLSHYAARTWPGQHKGAFHFYGHSHGRLAPFGRSRDVGVDCPDTGYAPRTFKQLTAGMDLEPVVAEEVEPGYAP